ncbi:hypothetical protein AAH978_01925 [Streptomyces sp. ZYX-F-203]
MDVVFVVLVVLVVLFAFLGLGVYAVAKAVGAARRGADRTLTQARRVVEDQTLKAKSLSRSGSAGELARLRMSLRTSMRATQDALHAGVSTDESLRESLDLFRRLSAHGHELDAEMRLLESDPDRAGAERRLPELRERTRRVTEAADSLRWAARDRSERFAGDDLDTLTAQIELETGALRHWTAAESAADSAPPWPDAPAAEEEGGRQTWPESEPGKPEGEAGRPAIPPHGFHPTYPWQRRNRPENTT